MSLSLVNGNACSDLPDPISARSTREVPRVCLAASKLLRKGQDSLELMSISDRDRQGGMNILYHFTTLDEQ